MAERTERINFEKDEVKFIMEKYGTKKPEKALEEWAMYEYDLRHNASMYVRRVGKTFVEIAEMP